MGCYVLGFQEIDQTQVAAVGGKGAHLGELSRIEGLRVPAGFCVTTDAFQRIMADAPSIDERLEWHNQGPCGYTRQHRPWSVIVSIEFPDEPHAARFEKYLKSSSGRAFAERHF